MSTQWIPIYASAVSLIALMVAFANHNRKVGWKKTRPTMLEALNELYADLGVGNDSTPIAPVVTAPADYEFSLQLLQLRGAMGTSRLIVQQPTFQKSDHLLVR